MTEPSARDTGSGKQGLAAVGIGVLAIACCAGLPLIAASAGGVAIGAVLGIGAGLLAAAVLVGAVVIRVRARRRARERRPASGGPALGRRQ